MAEASFQDIMKLMTSMTSFEALLDSTALVAETCVKLGIDEDLKRLCAKLTKFIPHETDNELNFKSVCNICHDEIQIFNFDIRTSLAIHTAGEVHRAAVKNVELDKENPVESVSNLIDFDYDVSSDLPSADDLEGKEKNPLTVDLNNIPKDLLKTTPNENSIAQKKVFVNNLNADVSSPCTCQQLLCICGYKDKTMSGLNEKLSNLNVKPQAVTYAELQSTRPMLPHLLIGAGIQPEECNISNGKNASPQNFPNQDKPYEKISNLNNVSQNAGVYVVHPAPLGMYSMAPLPLFPGVTATVGSTQPSALKGKSPSTETRQNKTPRDRRNASKSRGSSSVERIPPQQTVKSTTHDPKGKKPPPQNHPNKNKPQDANKYTTKSSIPVVTGPAQQSFNIHVHMPLTGDRQQSASAGAAAITKKPIAPKQSQPPPINTDEANLELLRSKQMGFKEEMQLMFKLVRKAEGKYWGRRNFSKVHNEQNGRTDVVCNVCDTGALMPCSYHVVQHARGRAHQNALRTTTVEDVEYKDSDDQRKARPVDEPCVVM